MSKKIHGNSICPLCNSGLKYKDCCGKKTGLFPNTSIYITNDINNLSEFEKEVFEKTGFYSRDFINPIKNISDVIYVIIDESNLKEYYSVSGIVVLKSEIDKNNNLQPSLCKLVKKYGIDYIHFTEIFGRNNLLKENRKNFLNEYADIITNLDMKPFTICMTKKQIEQWIKSDSITDEQCYIALTWKLMFNIIIYCTYKFGNNIIIELWRENENVTVNKRLLHKKNCIDIINQFPFANISIYGDYLLFMKSKILFSSLSDLVAYTTTKFFSKLDKNISSKKILNNKNYELLALFKKVFKDSTYMNNKKFDEILKNIE